MLSTSNCEVQTTNSKLDIVENDIRSSIETVVRLSEPDFSPNSNDAMHNTIA